MGIEECRFSSTLGNYQSGRYTTSNASILAFDVYVGFLRKEEMAVVEPVLKESYKMLTTQHSHAL